MIRPFTLICMLLACGSGLYLYQTKHRVQLLDREISRIVQATTAARDRAGVLRTEWTLLNDLERLRALADQHLQLRPVAPGQFTTLAELGNRLPPPRVPEPERSPTATVQADMGSNPQIQPEAETVIAELPAPPVPPPAPTPALAPAPAPAPRAQLASAEARAVAPKPAPRPVPRIVAEPAVVRAVERRQVAEMASHPASRPIIAAPAAPAPTYGASQTSSLGMAGRTMMLPPPVPVSAYRSTSPN